MLKRIALLTALVASAATPALADPRGRVDIDARVYVGDQDRYDRYDTRYRQAREGMQPLANRLRGRGDIQLRAPMRMNGLVIQGHRGAATVGAVVVRYAHGGEQRINVSQPIRRGQTIRVELDRSAAVRHVTVFISGGNGSYSVFAE